MPTDPAQPFDRLSLDALRRRQSLKWRAYPPDVLPLFVAEMDTLPAPAVRAALDEALDLGDTGYPWGPGYAEAYADAAQAAWGWRPDPAATALVADVMTGVVEVLALVTGPGDAVVIVPPVYPPFAGFVTHTGRRLVEAPLGVDGRLDLDALERACADAAAGGRRAALLLASPHNPTGTVHTAAELAAVAALAERHGVRVVVDEIHAPLTRVDGPAFTPYLAVPGAERGFVVFSASKAWNLAGLKAALAVAGPGAAAELAAMPEVVGHGASSLGVLAHTAALRGGQEWLAEHRAGLDAQQRLLGRLLAEHLPALRWTPPQATYLAWLDCRALDLPADPAAFFLEHARVALGVGPDFGTGGAGHVRLNFATSTAVLTEAVERMAAAVGR
ncbi:MalY/PatB family protein [Microlunatus capsulatus]|uniref:cysteine-S-conjugate beta-lyase n=1 Tax=Microlunatus capsulatus TaxID=99117 RepID=A0ABS4Z7M9_9ACTN|nr:aminotransferase class I/II-fold pyridoxal phosphate-dependent enzyme [Microlunatus capsulatus]MBP2417055.1 cystathionine beta-lyase [Microlunatus capsulatus]